MNAKEADSVARSYLEEMFEVRPTLEEVWFDEYQQEWCVTFGIRRHSQPNLFDKGLVREITDYTVVRVRDSDGKPISIRLHETERAA